MQILLKVEIVVCVVLAVVLILRVSGVLSFGGTNGGIKVVESPSAVVTEENGETGDTKNAPKTEEEVAEMMNSASDALASTYMTLLAGTHDVDGKQMTFGADGSFSGFMKKGSEDVNGTYVMTNNNGAYAITITAGEESVTYPCNMDEITSGKIYLLDEDGKTLYTIEI